MLIFGLMLLQTAACLDRFCRFDQSDPCHAALGHKLNLMMVQDTSEYDLKITKRINNNTADDPVCRVKNGRMRTSECDLYNNRPEVTVIDGTLIINRVIRTDSGNYRLTLSGSVGTETSRDLQVIVEGAPSTGHSEVLIGLGCLAVILIVLVIIAYYIYKKKNQLKHTNVENVSEGPQAQEKKEQEIQYGEVIFTDSKVRQQPCKAQDECLYAQVQSQTTARSSAVNA